MPQLEFVTFSSQIFWLIVTFGIFYFLMSKVALPAIVNVRQNRQERISGDLDAAEKNREEAETLELQYLSAIEETAIQSSAVMEEANQTISDNAANEYKKLEAALEKKFIAAQDVIDDLERKAVEEVTAISSGLSQKIVEKLSSINIGDKQVQDVVSKTLKQR